MKISKSLPPPSKSDKRMLIVSAGIFISVCVLVGLAVFSRGGSQTSGNFGGVNVPSGGTPLPADVIAKLTEIPGSVMLTGALADEIHGVEQMVAACPDYSAARRDQIKQHVAWLLAPATLPPEIIIALGANVNGRLILGIATYTLSDWGIHQKAPDSCLLTIGKKLNELLITTGEEQIPAFDVPPA